MKKSTLLLFALFAMLSQVNSQVTIGAGNLESENAPFEAYYGYSYSQTVYLASEINASGNITDIQWYYSGTTALPNSQELVIYMAELPRTEYADTDDWEPIASFTQVYTGGITVTAGTEGWVTITLDTPFAYTGTDNLVIAVEENLVDYDNFADDFYNSQVATNRTISYYNDSTNPDPATPPTANNIDDTIPNIILGGITQACPTPSDISASGITSDEAMLSWTEIGSSTDWNIEYNSGADFTPGNSEEENAIAVTGTPNTTLTGLTPASTYYIYYQSNCGSGELSSWAGPLIIDTECVTFIAPYTQGFENAGDIPLCWSNTGAEEWEFADDTGFDHIGDNGTITGSTATNGYFAWVDSSGTEGPSTLTTPLVDVSGLIAPALSFYEISDNEGNANSTLDVEVWDGAAWNSMATYNTNTSGWELKVIDLSTLTITGDVQARFIFSETESGDFYDDIAIDDVTFDEAPSCFNPTTLTASAITSNSAELSWSQDGSVTMWNIEIVTAGTAATGTPTDTDISNPYTASGLSAITGYEYYVQANCGSELSGWAGPFAFETLCDVFIPDYIQNFTNIPADCWEVADNGDATTGPTDLGNSSWTQDGFLNDGFDGAYKINLWVASKSDWLISPQFDLTGGPFQVEFDFGVMTFGSSTTAGTLGSDDTVQLLMTNDNGATWINLLTYDTNSVIAATGEHPVVDLTAYAGQIVQFGIFASEGTVDDTADNDVFVDNFRVRGIPTCPEPSDLTANNLSLTSTEVGWTESGTATSWNIQYGEAGFALGTGTIEAGVTTNPYVLTGLTSDTSYEFYVSAICGPGDESSYFGPFQFFTGYCESIPTSNDGDGVNYVNLGVTTFTSLGDLTYENHTTPSVNVFQGINTNVEIEFGHGFTYGTNIWIDFDDNLVFDDTELVYQGTSSGASSPHLLDASFVMPITAPLGEHRMRIGSADFGQSTPDPCYNGSWGVTLDFTVNIQELLCTLAEADYTVTPDCDNSQFYIDVNVTSLGDATSLEISNTLDTSTVQATATGVYQAGPFPFGSSVKVFVTNEQDNNCVISSETYEVLACPPANDDCVDAIAAVVNATSTCDATTPGTILAATPSGVTEGSCTGSPDDDVWFSFEALDEIQIISIINIVGGTTNIDHALYEGTCGSLTELYCSNDAAAITPSLVIGNTYYVRVFSGGTQPETSTFDLCIKPAPTNIICDNAENFCSVGGALTTPNVIGIPSTGPVACLGSIPNPTWNIIQVGESGPIEIQIEQTDANGNGLDVDFVIWGPFTSVTQACTDILLEDCPSCPFSNNPDTGFYPLGNIVDCSYSASSIENLSIDNAVSGEIYMLLVTNFNGGAGDITIEQTNADASDNGTIEAEIDAQITSNEVGIPEDNDPTEADEVSVCGYETVTLSTNSPFADEFIWYEDGFVIPNETSSTLTVPSAGFGIGGATKYLVQAFDNQCGSDAFSQEVIINFYDDPGTIAPQNITVCDGPEANGSEEFDLDALTTDLGLGDGFTVSYYTNTGDANQAINAVSSPYTSTGETLIIRIEDTDAATNDFLGCRQLSQVELTVNPRPSINQPANFIVCDDEDGAVDGETNFDLTSINADVTTDTNIEITYHNSQADADADTAAIASPYTSQGETIYVRAEDTVTGCYSTTSFNLEVNIVPLASFDESYVYAVCPNATVPVTIGITGTNFTADDVTVSWSLNGNPISGNGLTLNSVLVEGDYSATIEFNDTGCANTITTFVVELESCVFPEGISPGVSPGQNDTFDLTSFNVTKLEIFNRNGTLVYSKNNYTNEWYGQTNDGDELPVGTYFYTVVYEGGAKSKSSWVYINR
ncbi:fibronectin type III domain-containing protein [Winogradskyella litoriviva]|uniref:Fibronectin type III domain-containing protein n=1 Tax=Winogradskyella litoriviva TaxID=1220182 RepID=A0ABX2E249_9FLAO|nr:fibronectin type III domain-containing protein [Winogradskyella litoriviva]NRD22307.1 fibronectin type III domain-containing protein [Winogradskyella litoriviva]